MNTKQLVGTWQLKGKEGTAPFWHIRFFPQAHKEAQRRLIPAQYWHIADQIKTLALCEEPKKCKTVNVAPISEIWELKDKGGILGKINLRIFFFTDEDNLIILGVHKKEDEGQLRTSVLERYVRRKRLYMEQKLLSTKGEGKS